MRKPRVTGQAAVNAAVYRLINEFQYPDEKGSGGFVAGGGGGMAHILIVSTSEPEEIQAKADFVVPESNSSAPLQSIFDSIDDNWSIWMAGSFELNNDVTAPAGCWIRGLGYPTGFVL